MNRQRVTSYRGDDFYVNAHLGTLDEVMGEVKTHLPDVTDLLIRGGPDEELLTVDNEKEILALQSYPLVIEYRRSGGGAAVPEEVTSVLDLRPQVDWYLPTLLRVHLCGQEVAVVLPSLLCGGSSREDGGSGSVGLGMDLRWPCYYQTLDCSQPPQLQCCCCSLLPCHVVTALPVSQVLLLE